MSDLLQKFKCTNCKEIGLIELIESGCIVSSYITQIKQYGENQVGEPVYDVTYQKSKTLDGETCYYQCEACGWKLEGIESDLELIVYLKKL